MREPQITQFSRTDRPHPHPLFPRLSLPAHCLSYRRGGLITGSHPFCYRPSATAQVSTSNGYAMVNASPLVGEGLGMRLPKFDILAHRRWPPSTRALNNSQQSLPFSRRNLLFPGQRLLSGNRRLLLFKRSLQIFKRSLLLTARSLNSQV